MTSNALARYADLILVALAFALRANDRHASLSTKAGPLLERSERPRESGTAQRAPRVILLVLDRPDASPSAD